MAYLQNAETTPAVYERTPYVTPEPEPPEEGGGGEAPPTEGQLWPRGK